MVIMLHRVYRVSVSDKEPLQRRPLVSDNTSLKKFVTVGVKENATLIPE